MAINIQGELEKQYQAGQGRAQSLTDRLTELDKYRTQVNPEILGQLTDFSDRPAGYNPMQDIASAIQVIERASAARNQAVGDLSTQQTFNRGLLSDLAGLQDSGSGLDALEQMLKVSGMAGEQGLKFDLATGQLTVDDTLSQGKLDIISTIDKLVGQSPGKIAGIKNISTYFPGTEGRATRETAKQLGAMLSVEAREKLRGSGQISDYESRLLANAASDLGIDPETGYSSLSDKEFSERLAILRNEFGGEQVAGTQAQKQEETTLNYIDKALENY